MTWVTIPDSDIDPDSPITTGLMTALRDNVPAAIQQDSGAPAFGAAVIGQNELKTTTGSGSVTPATYSSATIAIAGGTYAMITASANGSGGTAVYFGGGNTAAGVYGVHCAGVSLTWFYDSRYIQASPPYDLGDGDIPLFVFAEIDNASGKVLSHYLAPEAPWHYTYTDIRATRKEGARSWREVPQIIKDLQDANLTKQEAVRLGVYTKDEIYSRIKTDVKVEAELTQAIKNADMILRPSPFTTGRRSTTTVMLDPVSPKTIRLLEMHDQGENLGGLLLDNKFNISNTSLNRVMPSGVIAVDYNL